MRRTSLSELGNRVHSVTRGVVPSRAPQRVDDTWSERRGTDQYRGTFDVIGNFPGYARCAALIVSGNLAITSRYLIVDEWAEHGFAIDLGDLLDFSIDADPDTFEDIVVRYKPDTLSRVFRLRVTRSRLPVRGKSRASELAQALANAGAADADYAKTIGDAFTASWDSLATTDSDSVVWKGRVTAPLRPGRECAPTDVWVTPTALIWGSTHGKGVNRIPLSNVERLGSVALNDAAQSPAVYIRTTPVGDSRLDLPFIFNQSGTASGTQLRDTFLAIFRGDAIQDVELDTGHQPWRQSVTELAPVTPGDGESGEHDPSDPVADDLASAAEVDVIDEENTEQPVFETWVDVRRPISYPYGSGDDKSAIRRIDAEILEAPYSTDASGTRLADALTSWPGSTNLVEASPPEPEPISEPRALITYLARARRSIDEVTEAVDRRLAGQAAPLLRAMPPSSEEQSSALAELIELAGTDYYSVEQARTVKQQIIRLGEAAIRLRSLLELCNAGHMTIAEVAIKRDVIMSGLPIDEGIE